MTIDKGEDVNNGSTGHVATCMDSPAVLKDATLSSDWSCKATSQLVCPGCCTISLAWLEENSWDQWRDGQTTVTHYPTSFDHILLTLCSSFKLSINPCFHSSLFLTNLSLFPRKFLGARALSFWYVALKHTGHWNQPVTLYIETRPREMIGKRREGRLRKKQMVWRASRGA